MCVILKILFLLLHLISYYSVDYKKFCYTVWFHITMHPFEVSSLWFFSDNYSASLLNKKKSAHVRDFLNLKCYY